MEQAASTVSRNQSLTSYLGSGPTDFAYDHLRHVVYNQATEGHGDGVTRNIKPLQRTAGGLACLLVSLIGSPLCVPCCVIACQESENFSKQESVIDNAIQNMANSGYQVQIGISGYVESVIAPESSGPMQR